MQSSFFNFHPFEQNHYPYVSVPI